MKAKGGYIYIITNISNNVLYTGVTSDLYNRIHQHKTKHYPNSFSARYNCNKLVYYKFKESIEEAIDSEKKLKNQKRDWKIRLINSFNPDWNDLFDQVEDCR